MKITVEFESMKEFKMFMSAAEELEEEKTKQVKEPEKAAEPEPEPEPEPEQKAEKPKKEEKKPKAVDYDALRVECRKVLAELNKVTGKNTASEMIKSHGAEKLTQVEDEFLPELLEEAKEALNNAK